MGVIDSQTHLKQKFKKKTIHLLFHLHKHHQFFNNIKSKILANKKTQ